jgi:rhodanese-related sulfurtransferase
MTDGPFRDPDTAGTLRGIVFIVATGVVLGVLYNAIGLASRPPHGLAWIPAPQQVGSLEEMQPAPAADTGGVAPPVAPPAPAGGPSVVTPPSTAPAAGTVPPATSAPPRPDGARPAPPPGATTPPSAVAPPSSPAAATPGTPPPAAAALPQVPDLDQPIKLQLASLKRFYDAGAVIVVDAREAGEYAEGHIAGALNLPYNDAMAEPERMGRLGENGRPIVVYCSGGDCEASMDLAKLMLQNGRHRVLVYEGGWPEWRDAGFPTARGAAAGGR